MATAGNRKVIRTDFYCAKIAKKSLIIAITREGQKALPDWFVRKSPNKCENLQASVGSGNTVH